MENSYKYKSSKEIIWESWKKMTRKYIEEKDYDKHLKVSGYPKLGYYSKKAIRKKYPQGGYILIGGIGEGLKQEVGNFCYEQIPYTYFTLHYPKWRYEFAGYIHLDNEEYIAVMKSRLLQNLLFFILFSILLVGVWLSGNLLGNGGNKVDLLARDYTPADGVQIETDNDHIALPNYRTVKMEANTNMVYIALWNPVGNPCMFKFTLTLDETGEVLYTSNLIPPGKAITEVELSKTIKEGTYPMTIKIDTFSLEDTNVSYNGGLLSTQLVAISKE